MADYECRLREYRTRKGLAQRQLAQQVGMHRETIMRMEKARRMPALKAAVDVCRAVDATVEEIFIFP